MASQITATLPTLDFPKEVDYPTQEDWAAFSAAAELNFGILGNDWSTQMQLWKTEANAMSTELNTNATIAQGLANYQGNWTSKGYTLGQTVSIGEVYYICKLTHSTGQNPTDVSSLYWDLALGNWSLKADKTEVALKIDKDISPYSSKSTPIDSDLIPLSDSAATFGIKKLTWANIKATLKTYFDTLYTVASSETTAGVIELATTAEAQSGTDAVRAITPLQLFNSLKGSNQSLASSGYQKLHGGLIIQWGSYTTGTTTVTLPIAYPTAHVYAGGSSSTNAAYVFVSGRTLSSFGMNSTAASGTWISIGY